MNYRRSFPSNDSLPTGCPIVSNSRAAYFRQRYANLWLFARLRGVYEPLGVLFMSVWLSYSTWDTAQHHMLEAACLGSMLGASFLVTLFLLLMGLVAGGRWREMPRSLSWALVQKLEMVSDTARVQRHTPETTWSSKP